MRTLSITLADELYESIKHTVPPRQISKFVAEAVEVKLKKQTDELYDAYLLASQDINREEEAKEWDEISLGSWEERL